MALKLFNTLTKKKEPFKSIEKGRVGIYTCGPTVYSHQHIGNLRSYLFADILVAVLKYNNLQVKQIINVTDVGHLTSDADTGEDKVEKAAKKEGKKASQITNYYFNIFKEDFKKLNIVSPDKWTKATEHIKEQIELIKKLETKGYTYQTADGVYFDTSKLKDYGKLARLKKEGLQAGKRIAMGEKKNITDFALWKFSPSHSLPATQSGTGGASPKQAQRQQEWKSPWGVGFPGWHIECSAMSMKYLGNPFDIHTGGIDHIPIHHTNEIAQSEAATGKSPVNYWLHGAFLISKGKKISKSTGGLLTVSELEEKGFNPLAFRYFTLMAHYRSPLSFSLEGLTKAANAYQRLKKVVADLPDAKSKQTNKEYLKKFQTAINDDLNMPVALRILWNLVRDKKAKNKVNTIKEFERIFKLDLFKKERVSLPIAVKKLVEQRQKARTNKNWAESDKLRQKIKTAGFLVEDTSQGQKIKKV